MGEEILSGQLADVTHLVRVEYFVLRAPIAVPVQTSFGKMNDRPTVLIRITDADGCEGWGEIWCNFPTCGAEHRARLVETVFRPVLEGMRFESIQEAMDGLQRKVRILAIQSGEPGPFAQVLAGIDCALWDLAARRAGLPLWQFLGGTGEASVPAYASGINPTGAVDTVAKEFENGHRAFKIKIGFDSDQDLANIRGARAVAGSDVALMADANQAWTVEHAIEMGNALAGHSVSWLEEPIAADSPLDSWAAIRMGTTVSLAAGENVRGLAEFESMIRSGTFDVIQPDCAKWGGVSDCMRVARSALAGGLRYCPHFLGSGVGLAVSAHMLKAVGGSGLLEIDINENPLREDLAPWSLRPIDGRIMLPEGPGIGVVPEADLLERYKPKS